MKSDPIAPHNIQFLLKNIRMTAITKSKLLPAVEFFFLWLGEITHLCKHKFLHTSTTISSQKIDGKICVVLSMQK